MIVADTNVISELMKPVPNAAVQGWAQSLRADELLISVISVQEVEFGLQRLPDGKRRQALIKAWRGLLGRFEAAVLDFDIKAARATAAILSARTTAGQPMSLADAQIAGSCVSSGCWLATRNTSDFVGVSELNLVNPFQVI